MDHRGKVPGIRGDLVHFPVEVTGLSGFMQTKGCQGCTLIGAIKAADFPVPAGGTVASGFPIETIVPAIETTVLPAIPLAKSKDKFYTKLSRLHQALHQTLH
ncbi:hypothetical protein B5F83_08600 [Muribaculum sp. An289]|nr:hypothetical protein B5F83_08600 [Muribaculum sp. An289]OUO42120.1 hypothetical protein B5F81_08565 [Muribaculum sp. An287]